MPEAAIRANVEDYLRKSRALEQLWHHPITAVQLQAELDRMARDTRDPKILQELFDALGGDALLVAETLARQTLSGRLLRNWYAADERLHDEFEIIPPKTGAVRQDADMIDPGRTVLPKQSFDAWWERARSSFSNDVEIDAGSFVLPTVDDSSCANDSWTPTHSEVPDVRLYNTAVWTGTEMIVWGGSVSWPSLNTGGRYNPATDSWTAMSIGSNAPTGRSNHTAIWTGTEMIVWGGYTLDVSTSSSIYFSDGGRYNPATDQWTAISTGANVPTARARHTAVWTGAEMIVWGGGGPNGRRDNGGRYDPTTDRWTPLSLGPNLPSARVYHTAVWTGTEMIVWGGQSNLSFAENSGARYRPATDTWAPVSTGANLPSGRYSHSAVWTGTEMIVWGGDSLSGRTNTGGRYNPATDQWIPTSTGANVPVGRNEHTAVWTGTEMIVWGGTFVDFIDHQINTGARYDPTTDSWTPTSTGPNVPAPRSLHTAVWTGAEMIVWGGFGGGSLPYPPSGGRYSPSTDSWIPTGTSATVPSARSFTSAVWTGAEMIAWGGQDITFAVLNSGGRYTPSTDTWTPTSMGANVPSPGSGYTVVWTGIEMIVWGGPTAGTGGRYNPLTDRWSPISTGPNATTAGTAVWTGMEMIVWGGYPGVNSGGRYDPTTDTWRATSTGSNVPAGRYGHTAVWTGHEMIVWGGRDVPDHKFQSGGRYDPSTDRWIPTSTGANDPAARSSHSAVWTGAEMIVWGGTIGGISGFLNTGGRYDPSTDAWTTTSTGANTPSARSDHTAVWTGADMIVWGGTSTQGRLATGGRYVPSTDLWTATSTGPNVPGGRTVHTAVWTGPEMIVWGGDVPTSTGGRYCACPDGRILYRDADGDGYGNSGIWISSCDGSVPAGYVADATDCNDGNPSIHPGLTEVCNGIDDDCNAVTDDGGDTLCEDCDVCTDDSCRGVVGCRHGNNTAPCDDGDACTSSDACSNGICVGGSLVNCDDGNCCSLDSCNPATGCVHAPNMTPPIFIAQPSLAGDAACAYLWPPQHGYVDFTIADTAAAATSSCGEATFEFSSCQSSQPEDATGVSDGGSVRDCVYEPGAVHVRAERDGACSPLGRFYTMTLDAVDVCGNRTTSRPFTLNVWHDRAHGPDAAPGPISSAAPGSGQSDSRSGTNGTYGANCGAGAGPICGGADEVHDTSDDDPDDDQIPNYQDDCLDTFDPQQRDDDADGQGDACDPDDGLIDLVRFTTHATLSWEPDPTAASYNVYRGTFQNGTDFSNALCYIKTSGRPVAETAIPPPNRGYFYLVTRVTSSGVESSPGYRSDGVERSTTQRCP